jgi:hypothetical protein
MCTEVHLLQYRLHLCNYHCSLLLSSSVRFRNYYISIILYYISWTDRVNNEAVLHGIKEERNILHTIRRREVNWIGHILRRNCLLSHIIEGKIIGTRRRGRRRKQLLDDLTEARRYWKLKQEAQDRIFWRTSFGRCYGHVARQTTTWLDVFCRSSQSAKGLLGSDHVMCFP